MQAIQPLWEQMPLQPIRAEQPVQETGGKSFTNIFQSAIDAVRETDAEVTQLQYLMSTGQLDNPAAQTIASTKAQLSVDLLLQLRNKALDAYSELMRISL